MKNKIAKKYQYSGLGFPIELHDVELVEINGEYHPKIDVRAIADKAIRFLVWQESRFTGDQINFIRKYFSMSLREFAVVVKESHMAVKKWEDFGDKQTNMDSNIEFVLRLHMFSELFSETDKKIKKEHLFYNYYQNLTNTFSNFDNKLSNSSVRLVCAEDLVKYNAGVADLPDVRPFQKTKRDKSRD